MILYVTLGTNDISRAARFYDAVFSQLGIPRLEAGDGWAGWGSSYDDGFSLWLCPPFDGKPASAGNGTMISLAAASAAQVRAFYKAAMANGGSDEGAPGTRAAYGPDFYVAYVRDPDGNKLACAFHRYDPSGDQ